MSLSQLLYLRASKAVPVSFDFQLCPAERESAYPIGSGIRPRVHQHGVNNAEHRNGRANPECEGKNRCQREAGMIAKLAEGKANVLQECEHDCTPRKEN